MTAAILHTYLGVEERIYSSYLSEAADGTLATLRGKPGGDPVVILRAGGDEQLPDVPADDLWVAVEPAPPAESKTARKTSSDSQPDKTGT